jgi:signal transduction histidine kinase
MRDVMGLMAFIENEPIAVVVVIVGFGAVTVTVGFALRWLSDRTRSLLHLVLAITFCSLLIGAAGAVVLAQLMVLDAGDRGGALIVLGLTAVLATLLAVVSSKPLGRDIQRLESTVRAVEAGDLSRRTGVDRADELGHVARALDELVQRLDELERDRERYESERTALLSSVSHDLRTPLAALQVSVEALADGMSPDPVRYVRSMSRDVQAISALVDDLFLLSRIEHGDLDRVRESFDLAEIADEAVEALAPVAAARDLQLRLEAASRVAVNGNATAIGRVIRNLIDNAIRHAPTRSTVVVQVFNQSEPTVRVLDHGPGFPDEFVVRAFDQFSRADTSRSRHTGGAGLGLAIARGLVEAHGGRIWIEPAEGGKVAFALPAA